MQPRPDIAEDDTDHPAGAGGVSRTEEGRFLRLAADCLPDVRRVVIGFVGNAHDADDVLQETLLKLYDAFESYDPKRSFRVWACAVASNTARDFLRRRRVRRGFGLSDEVINALAHVRSGTHELTELRQEKLQECLGALPVKDRELIWDCYGDDVLIKDWAESRGLAVSTVGSRLRRLRDRLAACVNRKMGAA